MREKYESLAVADLREIAKSRGIKGVSTMKKGEVVEAMLALDEEEKKRYRRQLEDSERQIENLKREQFIARREADRLRLKMESEELQDRWEPNNRVLMSLLNGEKSSLSIATIRRLIRLGYLDDDGNINEEKIINTLAMRT